MKYNQLTVKFMKGIRLYLLRRYGKIDPSWELMLSMLQDNIQQYQNVMDIIEENGIMGKINKNPLLSTAKDLLAVIMKQIQHIGCSPYAEAKIQVTAEDDTEDFLDILTGTNNNNE